MEWIGQAVVMERDQVAWGRRHAFPGVDETSYSDSGLPVSADTGLDLRPFSGAVRLVGQTSLFGTCPVLSGRGDQLFLVGIVR